MSSTATSDLLIQVQDLHLRFFAPHYRSWTLRDLAVDFIKKPLASGSKGKNMLDVLKGVSFEVRRGDRLAILGRNGAGKTSLCRCIAGIYRQSYGQIQVHGEVRAVFDTSIGIQPELTGFENLELLSRFIYPEERERRQELIAEVGEFSGLGSFLHRPFKLYSNGMKARLGLSMVTAKPADILILDEVFDGADAAFRTKMVDRMNHLIQSSGAVIFVSHTPDQIRKVCNKAMLIEDGRVRWFGEMDRALDMYENLEERPRLDFLEN